MFYCMTFMIELHLTTGFEFVLQFKNDANLCHETNNNKKNIKQKHSCSICKLKLQSYFTAVQCNFEF